MRDFLVQKNVLRRTSQSEVKSVWAGLLKDLKSVVQLNFRQCSYKHVLMWVTPLTLGSLNVSGSLF